MSAIREWAPSDAKDLALALNNKKILDNLRDGIPFPYTERDAEAYIQSVLNAPSGSQYAWAIQAEGKAVGSIGIFRQENIHRFTAELGYYIAEPCWGKGLVTQAVKEACEAVFAQTDIVRIFAEPFAHNAASCRVLEKAGFVFEGRLKKNALKNGQFIDMLLYALVR